MKISIARMIANLAARGRALGNRFVWWSRWFPPARTVDTDRFHAGVLAASGNQRLVGLLSGVVVVSLVRRTFHRYSPEALARSHAHHRELLAALAAGDPEWAASVMRSHVLAARAVLR